MKSSSGSPSETPGDIHMRHKVKKIKNYGAEVSQTEILFFRYLQKVFIPYQTGPQC